MVKKLTVLTATFLLVIFYCSFTANAQIACGPRGDIVKRLAEKFKEKQVAMGLDITGKLVEVFVSDKGDFTVLLSDPSGRTCIATTGQNWATGGFPEVSGVGT